MRTRVCENASLNEIRTSDACGFPVGSAGWRGSGKTRTRKYGSSKGKGPGLTLATRVRGDVRPPSAEEEGRRRNPAVVVFGPLAPRGSFTGRWGFHLGSRTPRGTRPLIPRQRTWGPRGWGAGGDLRRLPMGRARGADGRPSRGASLRPGPHPWAWGGDYVGVGAQARNVVTDRAGRGGGRAWERAGSGGGGDPLRYRTRTPARGPGSPRSAPYPAPGGGTPRALPPAPVVAAPVPQRPQRLGRGPPHPERVAANQEAGRGLVEEVDEGGDTDLEGRVEREE